MASSGLRMGLITVLAAALWTAASAQSSSCTSAIVSLSPCLKYITGTDTTPSGSCCQQLAVVVQSAPQCLCTVLDSGASSSLGITINQTQALALPAACNVQTPPASQCKGNAGRSASPTSTPSAPNVPSGGGSKTVPAAAGTSDGAPANQIPSSLVFSLVFVVMYLSTQPTTF